MTTGTDFFDPPGWPSPAPLIRAHPPARPALDDAFFPLREERLKRGTVQAPTVTWEQLLEERRRHG